MSANQTFFLGLHIGTVLLMVAAHGLRGRITLGPTLAFGALLTFLIWQISQAAWWVEWGPLRINAAHLGVMPALLVGGLVVYAMDGVKAGRTYVAVTAGTAGLATLYLEFLAQLGEVVPLPSFVFMSLYGQIALAGSLVFGLLAAMIVYEGVRRFLHWLIAMVLGLQIGLIVILIVWSTTSYGFPLALVNIANGLAEFAVAGLLPGAVLATYGVFAGYSRWILPARPIGRLFATWRATEEEVWQARETAMEARHTIAELQDLNRQLEREKRLREHQVENSPLAVLEVDRQGRITSANRAARELLGNDGATEVGVRLDGVLPGFADFLVEPERVSDLITLPAASEGPRTLAVTAMPLYEQGDLHGFSVLVQDVTERERARLRRQIVGRMRGVHMAGRVIAHDFANLITAIEGNVASIRHDMGENLPQNVDHSLTAIRQAVGRARQMLDRFGGAQPFTEPKLEPCRLDALVGEAVAIERPTAENRGVALEIEAIPQVWVDVDSTQIVRVLLNLLRNAIEATPRGSRIAVRADMRDENVTLEVRDEGRGMSEEQIAQAFQPGFSTKGSGEGGIGLAVSYLIADAHGGDLAIRSEIGHGTTAALTLNRGRQDGQNPQTASGIEKPSRELNGRRVLVAMTDGERREQVVQAVFGKGASDVAEVECQEEVAALLEDDAEWDILIRDGSVSASVPDGAALVDLAEGSPAATGTGEPIQLINELRAIFDGRSSGSNVDGARPERPAHTA